MIASGAFIEETIVNSTSVFVVWHRHTLEHGQEDVKMIGVYESRNAAEAAVYRVASLPGFRDCPEIRDSLTDEGENGFYIDEYQIGEDHWKEGYVTETP